MVDIVRSNVAVARLIVAGRRRRPQPGLRRDRPRAAATRRRSPSLAVIVTSTPGTAWVDYDAARGRLLLHVLDLVDEEEWRDTVNNRYGRLLKEIFE